MYKPLFSLLVVLRQTLLHSFAGSRVFRGNHTLSGMADRSQQCRHFSWPSCNHDDAAFTSFRV